MVTRTKEYQVQDAASLTISILTISRSSFYQVSQKMRATYGTVHADTRNVLLLGLHGAGKSILVNTLRKDATLLEPADVPRSSSGITVFTTYVKGIRMNIVDTPGIDTTSHIKDATEKQVKTIFRECIAEGITSLNSICFVAKAGQINFTALSTFRKIADTLGKKFSPVSLIVLTHCESYTQDKQQQLVGGLRNNYESRQFAEWCCLGALPSGAALEEQMELYAENVGEQLKALSIASVNSMKDNLLKQLISSKSSISLQQFAHSKSWLRYCCIA